MNSAPKAAIAQARAELRAALAARGFTDDGELLRGPVRWHGPTGPATAIVDIAIPDRYPFGPPIIQLHDAGASITVTFHVDPDGALCLWDNTEPAGDATWTRADGLIGRIAGWLEQTAVGWPDDEDCDLERYIPGPRAAKLVLYDADRLDSITGCVRTTESDFSIIVHDEQKQPPAPSRSRSKGRSTRHGKTLLPRGQRHLAYLADVGTLHAPLRSWNDVVAVLPAGADVRRYINQGAVELLVLRYRRGARRGVLAVTASPGRDGNPPQLHPCQAADVSTASRTLRAGRSSARLASTRVVIIGCGAVGSYVADLLYREGVRRFVLIDPDIYRPGNVVRHAAPAHLVGRPKVAAVAESLRALDLGTSDISHSQRRLNTPDETLRVVQESDVVIDATADEQAIALLRWAAESTGHPVISVCVQREGGIARADRFPLSDNEQHLQAVPVLPDQPPLARERGCGDAVSATPPSAVVAAAELAVELARDQLLLDCAAPATILRVLQPQPDEPYTIVTTIIANNAVSSGTS